MSRDEGDNVPESISLKDAEATMRRAQDVLTFIEENHLEGTEMAMYLLNHGVQVQQVAVMKQLHFYVGCDDDALKLVTLVLTLAANVTAGDVTAQPFQAAACEGVSTFLDTNPEFVEIIVNTQFERTCAVAELCDRAIVMNFIELLKKLVIKTEISHVHQTIVPWLNENLVNARPRNKLLGIHIAGALMQHIPDEVRGLIWEDVFRLHLDSNFHLRLAFVGQLENLCKAMGPVVTTTILMPQMINLMVDENHQVAVGFFQFLMSTDDFFDPGFESQVVSKLVFGYFHNNPPPAITEAVAMSIGKIAVRFQANQSNESAVIVCNAYTNFCLSSSERLREAAAFNAPAMLQEFRGFPNLLQDIVNQLALLAQDTNSLVRLRISAGFNKICQLLPSTHMGKAKDIFSSMLLDSSVEVHTRIANYLPELWRAFQPFLTTEAAKQEFTASTLSFIATYESRIRSNWRKVESLVQRFPDIIYDLSPADVVSYLLPILISHVTTGACAIKDVCSNLIVLVLEMCVEHNCEKGTLGQALGRGLRLAASSSAVCRSSFALITSRMSESMSDDNFLKCFEDVLLKFVSDPIPAVRRRLAVCAPQYPPSLAKNLLDRLENDKDENVRDTCRASRAEIRSSEFKERRKAIEEKKKVLDSTVSAILRLLKEYVNSA